MENIEKFKLIGRLIEEAERYGNFTSTLINDDPTDNAYFARKSGAAALKALSLIDQMRRRYDENVSYKCEETICGIIELSGWYWFDEAGMDCGPYESSGEAYNVLEKYAKSL
jgi:hypothetical protein